jgi:hypothetical protein
MSFVAALLTLLSLCAFGLYSLNFGGENQVAKTVSWVLMGLMFVAGLAGIGLGIPAVFQKNTSKLFGILGLVLSSLILIGFCLFIVFILGFAAFVLATI